MSAAVAAILEGMPEPRDLRMHQAGGRCVITAGSVVLFDYEAGDTAMRNMALAALRQLKFPGRVVAAVLGLSEAYVATLHNAARRDGSAALIGQPRPGLARHGHRGAVAAGQAVAGAGRQRRGDRAAAGGRAHHDQPAPGPARAGAAAPCSPGTGRRGNPRASRNLSPGRSRDRGLARVVRLAGAAGRGRAGRWCPRGCSGPVMRGRCCCTRSSPARMRGRCWPARRPGQAGRPGLRMRRCCRR